MRKFLLGLLLGAATGVLYAPATGNRARAWLRDKLTKLSNDTAHLMESKGRDLNNRAEGIKHNVNKVIEHAKPRVEQAKSAVQDAYAQVKTQVQEIGEDAAKTVAEAKKQRSA